MKLRRLAPVAALATLVFTTGCEDLLGTEEELLGIVCEDGLDGGLMGDWWALSMDWGEGDMIAQGWRLNIQLYDDGDGKLFETKPEETSGGTIMVTDSAYLRWAGCDGRLAVVMEEQFIHSGSGGFEDVLFDYSATADGLSLTGGGMTMTLTGGGEVPHTSLDPALFGSWEATHIIYTERDTENTPIQVDMVADQGHSMQVSLDAGGQYEEVYAYAGGASETYVGTWTAEDGILTLTPEAGSEASGVVVRYEVTDAGVTAFDDEGDNHWDFNGDGNETPASVEYRFVDRAEG